MEACHILTSTVFKSKYGHKTHVSDLNVILKNQSFLVIL